ncbi:hypothetical protein ElyMa_004522400 [Elysia marginata]|uniref:Galectin domain-containing protein n=1 Tax=Elysia marginata TaxID=1093978 RepID=A0AAV4HMV4_9GAST|nr:hypothetical protein ElyMa_004522400 [Elysia marginata]
MTAPCYVCCQGWVCVLCVLATVSAAVYRDCDLHSHQPNFTVGRVSGTACQELSSPYMTRAQCTLLCLHRNRKRGPDRCVGFSFSCSSDVTDCLCEVCEGLADIDFSAANSSLYLQTKLLADNLTIPPLRNIPMADGLAVGMFIRVALRTMSRRTMLYLMIPPQTVTFAIDIRSQQSQVVRNAFLNGAWGPEE